MDVKRALAGQFQAGLAMLRECVELCPDDLWAANVDKPPRTYWRIAYHTAFYTHFNLFQSREELTPWSKHFDHAVMTYADEGEELPPEGTIYTQTEVTECIDSVSEQMGQIIGVLDLESPESGFPWYPSFPKFDQCCSRFGTSAYTLVNCRSCYMRAASSQSGYRFASACRPIHVVGSVPCRM